MSALSDALNAAQRQALASIQKAYVAGGIERDECEMMMDDIGATDKVDQEALIASLDAIRRFGATVPAPRPNGPQEANDEPMTAAQRSFIERLWSDRGGTPADRPDLEGLTKARASDLISQLKTDTYDPAAWSIPF